MAPYYNESLITTCESNNYGISICNGIINIMTNQPHTIVSVERALQVLLALADLNKQVGITELSKHLMISKVAIYRIMTTLVASDFVIQDPTTSLYEMGPSVLRLTERFQIRNTLVRITQPYLEELASKTKEVTNLGIINNGKVLVLSSIIGRPQSRFTLNLGPVAEFHASSLGKALLSDKSQKTISSLLSENPLPKFTQNTKTTIKEFLDELDSVKSTGIAIDDEETEEGLMCIGAPIKDWNNNIIAAISVSGLKSRLVEMRLETVKSLVIQAADKITKRLNRENLLLP